MGKVGRSACIFTPMALTIASFVCILLINLGGYSKSSSTLNELHFFEVDFSNFSSSSGSSSELSVVLEAAVADGIIADFYQIHLWNYCKGNESSTNSSSEVTWCSGRQTSFWFNPLEVWDLESVLNSTASSTSSSEASSIISSLSSNITALEDELIDKSARDALKTYKKVSKWMFAAYFASLWFLLATVVFGVLAIFSRWFSFITWILSIIATVLVFGGSLTATIMFPILVEALKKALDGYNIKFSTSTHTLAVTWLATVFTIFATLFWLFSTCCCSGSSNPHHRSNRDAPAKDFGFAGFGGKAAPGNFGRTRSLKVEKTGGTYEPVGGPYMGAGEGDHVPLTQVAAPPYGHGEPSAYSHAEAPPYGHGESASYYHPQNAASPYEPYRHA